MQWSYVEIFDIFNILASICEASYIGDEEDEGRWFDHDKDALKATRVFCGAIHQARTEMEGA